MLSAKNKRKHPRIDVSFPLRYKELHEKEDLTRGTLSKNLCEGGVRFKSDRFISLACRLVVELNFPEIKEPVRAVARIAWIKKLPTGNDYEVGNQFLNMSKEDKKAVSGYLKNSFDSAPANPAT